MAAAREIPRWMEKVQELCNANPGSVQLACKLVREDALTEEEMMHAMKVLGLRAGALHLLHTAFSRRDVGVTVELLDALLLDREAEAPLLETRERVQILPWIFAKLEQEPMAGWHDEPHV
jgi:hypothetical protein